MGPGKVAKQHSLQRLDGLIPLGNDLFELPPEAFGCKCGERERVGGEIPALDQLSKRGRFRKGGMSIRGRKHVDDSIPKAAQKARTIFHVRFGGWMGIVRRLAAASWILVSIVWLAAGSGVIGTETARRPVGDEDLRF